MEDAVDKAEWWFLNDVAMVASRLDPAGPEYNTPARILMVFGSKYIRLASRLELEYEGWRLQGPCARH